MACTTPTVDQAAKAKEAAQAAGEVLRNSYESKTEALSTSGRDIKTQADLDAHKLITSMLADTEIPIISEESETHLANPTTDTCWIIDPLDGTVNFFRGSRLCCTSIGLWSEGRPVFGIVYDFLGNELWSGGIHSQTTCNDIPVVVSGINRSDEAIIATGFPNGRDFEEGPLKRFLSCIQSFRKVRLLGSAALSLAWLAQGRIDAYSEEDIYLWDIAAGLPIVLGAGGCTEFSSIDLETMKLNVCATGSAELLKELKC